MEIGEWDVEKEHEHMGHAYLHGYLPEPQLRKAEMK